MSDDSTVSDALGHVKAELSQARLENGCLQFKLDKVQKEVDTAKAHLVTVEKERNDAKMRRDMALKVAEAYLDERNEVQKKLREVENARVSGTLERLCRELYETVDEKNLLKTRLKTVKQERDRAKDQLKSMKKVVDLKQLKLLEEECKDERKQHEDALVSLRMELWTAQKERDSANAKLKSFEEEV
jgi:chromosome segregation ATPase